MNLGEFEKLTHEEKFKITQDRLFQLKKEGKKTKEFKNNEIDFCYTTAMNRLDDKYKLNQRDYSLIEKENEIKSKDITNNELEDLVNKILEDKLPRLNKNKTDVIELSDDYTKNVVVRKRTTKELKKMTITISTDVYERWKDFCEELGVYNNIDLLNTAITSYLDSVNFNK